MSQEPEQKAPECLWPGGPGKRERERERSRNRKVPSPSEEECLSHGPWLRAISTAISDRNADMHRSRGRGRGRRGRIWALDWSSLWKPAMYCLSARSGVGRATLPMTSSGKSLVIAHDWIWKIIHVILAWNLTPQYSVTAINFFGLNYPLEVPQLLITLWLEQELQQIFWKSLCLTISLIFCLFVLITFCLISVGLETDFPASKSTFLTAQHPAQCHSRWISQVYHPLNRLRLQAQRQILAT